MKKEAFVKKRNHHKFDGDSFELKIYKIKLNIHLYNDIIIN